MRNKNFIFLGNLISIGNKKKITILNGFKLKKANQKQVKIIKRFLESKTDNPYNKLNKFENEFIKDGDKININKLDPKDWNYYVIEFDSFNINHQLERVFSISSLNFTILFEANYIIDNKPAAIKEFPLKSLNYLYDSQFEYVNPNRTEITNDNIEEFKKINGLLIKLDVTKYSFIDKAIKDLLNIKNISKSSPFKILGYFSTLEWLLTSFKPNINNNTISIQLAQKINLINNQMVNNIDTKLWFKLPNTTSLSKLIETLYQYRNDVAHGNIHDFDKKLYSLKDQQLKILPFLDELLRKILLFSIENPQLILDLKDC